MRSTPPAIGPAITGIVVRGLGIVLLVAAVLKVAGTPVSPVANTGPALPPEWAATLVPGEFLLGGWFVSGFGVRPARIVAMVLFSLFSFVSWVAAVGGAASCGCLGAAPVSPWVVFGFDVVAVLTLLRCRAGRPWQADDWLAGQVAVTAGGLVAASVVAAVVWFGSPTMAVAALLNRPVAVDPNVLLVRGGSDTEPATAVVTFTNRQAERLQIITVHSDCQCVSAELPVWIEPGQAKAVTVSVARPNVVGSFTRRVGWVTTVGTVIGEIRGTGITP